jgi:hypothetical protein
MKSHPLLAPVGGSRCSGRRSCLCSLTAAFVAQRPTTTRAKITFRERAGNCVPSFCVTPAKNKNIEDVDRWSGISMLYLFRAYCKHTPTNVCCAQKPSEIWIEKGCCTNSMLPYNGHNLDFQHLSAWLVPACFDETTAPIMAIDLVTSHIRTTHCLWRCRSGGPTSVGQFFLGNATRCNTPDGHDASSQKRIEMEMELQ